MQKVKDSLYAGQRRCKALRDEGCIKMRDASRVLDMHQYC